MLLHSICHHPSTPTSFSLSSFFPSVFLAPPLRVSIPAGLRWPGLLLACIGHFKKKMCVCLCVFLHVCFYRVSPCKGRHARPLKWLRPFDRGQRFCLVSLQGWRVGGGTEFSIKVFFFFVGWSRVCVCVCVLGLFFRYWPMFHLTSATVFLLQAKFNYLSYLYYR